MSELGAATKHTTAMYSLLNRSVLIWGKLMPCLEIIQQLYNNLLWCVQLKNHDFLSSDQNN